jgi:hypothetical protein
MYRTFYILYFFSKREQIKLNQYKKNEDIENKNVFSYLPFPISSSTSLLSCILCINHKEDPYSGKHSFVPKIKFESMLAEVDKFAELSHILNSRTFSFGH